MAKIISSLPGSTGILSKTSQLINDGETGISTYVELDDISTVATTGDYNNLINVPINFTPKVHTHNISDISGTKSEFNTELTDGDFLFEGDITQYTDELAQDAVGNILTDSTTIDFTYNDTTPSISADVKLNSIDATHLANNINVSKFTNDSGYITLADVDGTDLTYSSSLTDGTIISSTGSDAIIPLASIVNAGLISPQEKQNIASAIQLEDLANVATSGNYEDLNNIPTTFNPTPHTHPISDIVNLQTNLDLKQDNLVSGTNIRTINGNTLLGATDLTIPVATDATTLAKGIVQLAGDLGGTADNPTTPTAIHKTGDEVKQGILTLSDGLKIVGNTTSTTATKVNVQENDGTINTISKSDLVNVVEVNDVPSLPLVGEVGKIYVVKNVNKIYRWNGTFYQELAVTDISGLQAQIDLKANDSDVVKLTGSQSITGTKTFNISQPIVGAQFNISATANGASAVAINNMNNGNAFYVDNKGGTAITVDLKNNSRGILISDYSGGGQTNELFTAVKGSNTVYQLNSEGQVLGKSFVKFSAPTTNILLAGGGDIAQNTAFNKNFGTTSGTVAEGNDSRILNGQTAFGWGNHAGLYSTTTGSNINQASFRTALDLGSNAYTSTNYLPLTGGLLSGDLTVYKPSGVSNLVSRVGGVYGYFYNDGVDIGIGSNVGSTGYKLKINFTAPDNSIVVDSNGNSKFISTVTATSYTATSLPVFENNAAANSLALGQFYRTSTGVLMVKF